MNEHHDGSIEIKTPGGQSTVRFGPLSTLTALCEADKTVVVADALTARFVPQEFSRCPILTVERGEDAKTPAVLCSLWEGFQKAGVGRDWTVLGLGGGSVSDLAGFAAATWMRGVAFGFAPTTLLAMVDASVGGKNGINVLGRKNQVGTIAQPRFVLMDLALLESLPPAAQAAGLAEAMKHAILDGPEHLALVEEAIRGKSGISLQRAVRASVRFKAGLVEMDEREDGARRLLNLGHSFGHGIEAVSGLPHGYCVSAGLACAIRLALSRGAKPELMERVLPVLSGLGLPVSVEEARTHPLARALYEREHYNSLIMAAMGSDKKRLGDAIHFALPMAAGDVRVEAIDLGELEKFLRSCP